MSVKVAINGFGRIGRLAFRQMFGAEGYEIVAINDLTKPSMLAHLLKYDTAQGRYDGHTVVADDEAGTITVDGQTIKIYAEKDAANCPWAANNVDVVLECAGVDVSHGLLGGAIEAGALQNNVNVVGSPRAVGSVLLGRDLDGLAVHRDGACLVISNNGVTVVTTLSGVVLKKMSEHRSLGEHLASQILQYRFSPYK